MTNKTRSLSHCFAAFLASLLCALSLQAASAPGEVDVIVYGGNAAGVSAAVQASRMGHSVLLIEQGRYIGGLTTGGLGATDTGSKETVGGIAKKFYSDIFKYYKNPGVWKYETREEYVPKHYLAVTEKMGLHWFFEPKVASAFLHRYLKEAKVPVLMEAKLDRSGKGVVKEGTKIVAIRLLDGREFKAKMFIDTTYEGDLMAAAGASYLVGRESNRDYNETLNGIRFLPAHRTSHVSPFVVEGDPSSGLLPRILPKAPGKEGEGDGLTQAYNFRVCLTDVKENQVPFTKPDNYDRINYLLVLRHVLGNPGMLPGNKNTSGLFTLTPMPNRKTDSNNKNIFSTDYVGRSWNWAEGSYEEREAIRKDHEDYTKGLFWFLISDKEVPGELRKEVARWGYPKDEFVSNGHWPHQLYIREARRLRGEYVVTEHDCIGRAFVDDPVALASYAMDSHLVSLFVNEQNQLILEGGFFKSVKPYPVSYRAILPKKNEVSNLLVPVCLSATHAAYGSIRMEPVFMMVSQSAATAACLAIEKKTSLHDLPYPVLKKRLLADGQILQSDRSVRLKEEPVKLDDSPETKRLVLALGKLKKAGIVNDEQEKYWLVNARPGKTCEGPKVAELLVAATSKNDPFSDAIAALNDLEKRKVLTRTAYWRDNIGYGKTCTGGQVLSLIERLANVYGK